REVDPAGAPRGGPGGDRVRPRDRLGAGGAAGVQPERDVLPRLEPRPIVRRRRVGADAKDRERLREGLACGHGRVDRHRPGHQRPPEAARLQMGDAAATAAGFGDRDNGAYLLRTVGPFAVIAASVSRKVRSFFLLSILTLSASYRSTEKSAPRATLNSFSMSLVTSSAFIFLATVTRTCFVSPPDGVKSNRISPSVFASSSTTTWLALPIRAAA